MANTTHIGLGDLIATALLIESNPREQAQYLLRETLALRDKVERLTPRPRGRPKKIKAPKPPGRLGRPPQFSPEVLEAVEANLPMVSKSKGYIRWRINNGRKDSLSARLRYLLEIINELEGRRRTVLDNKVEQLRKSLWELRKDCRKLV